MLYFIQFTPYFSLPPFFAIISSLQILKALDLKGWEHQTRGPVTKVPLWLLYISPKDFRVLATNLPGQK